MCELIKSTVPGFDKWSTSCRTQRLSWPAIIQVPQSQPAYCKLLMVPKYRVLFSKARLNVLPLGELSGGFAGIPFSEQLCNCKFGKLDSIWNFYCLDKYSMARYKWITVYIRKRTPELETVAKLLNWCQPSQDSYSSKSLVYGI